MGWKLLDGFMGCILHQPQASRRNRQMLEEHGYEPEPASASIFRLSSSSKSLYKQEDEPERSKEEKQVIITEGPKEGNRHKYKNNKLHGGPVNEELIAKEKQEHDPSVRIAPSKALKGEETASGWPIWLTTILQDALDGWTPRSAESYEKLDKIGQGTYSNVYKARDRTTGKIVALKKVRFDTSEQESVRFMAREIRILCRLDHPNVVKLEGLANSRMQYSLYLVFEYMESDLTSIITRPDVKLTEPQVKCYMQQLLQGLEHCQEKGVLHRDIKGSNLLVDKNGVLKIADFGLGTFFKPYDKKPLTNRVVTLWYRPPELLLGVTEYGVGIDLWSAGCLLGELFTGKPIMPGRTEVEQLHKIFKLCGSPSEDYWKKIKAPNTAMFKPQHSYKRNLAETFKDLPASALSLMNMLLALDPADRGTASKALKTECKTLLDQVTVFLKRFGAFITPWASLIR